MFRRQRHHEIRPMWTPFDRVLRRRWLITAMIAPVVAASSDAQVHSGYSGSVVEFRIDCSLEAQRQFEEGIALLHHMTYPRAREAFERVARIDPACAMAHWGIAMTLFQPLWPTRPGNDELRQGWAAVRTAATLGGLTNRDSLLVDAAAAFFRDPDSTDYWLRIRRWETAMSHAFSAHPADDEVAAFYALAHIAAAPVAADSVRAYSERAAEILLAVYRHNPSHPGAMHYLVHTSDVDGRERSTLDVVRTYESSAPHNPHALHMPTHIYTRLGEWESVIRGNLLAADAALEHPAGDSGQFVWDEFPHAIEYVIYAHLQQGNDSAASAQLARLFDTQHLEPSFKTAFHLASTRARHALERRQWSEAAALTPREVSTLPWERFSWAEGVTWFAKGLGAARERRMEDAQAAIERLVVLGANANSAGEQLFARNICILELEVRAWTLHAMGGSDSSQSLMRAAADLERTTPKHAVTPAPTLPAYELWGDLLLEQRRPADALDKYRSSLALYPRRFNGLLGAARAAAAAGTEDVAREFYRELLQVAIGPDRGAARREARDYVARH